MSWRTGSGLFRDFWPVVQSHVPDKDERVEFTAELLKLMTRWDIDPWEVEDAHPEVREALVRAGIGISEPDRYSDVSARADCAPSDQESVPFDRLFDSRYERLSAVGPDYVVFSLAPLIATTKRKSFRNKVRLIAIVLVHFLQDNGLTTREVLSADHGLDDELEIRVADLTEEGLRFYALAEQPWMQQVDGGASPTDTTLLAGALRQIRAATDTSG